MAIQSVKSSIWSYLQPVMLALAPLLIFLSDNIDIVKPIWAIRPVLLITIFALCIAFICHRVFRSHQHGMVIASLITVLFLHSGLLLAEIIKLLSKFRIAAGVPWFEQERQQLIAVLAVVIQVILIVMVASALRQYPTLVSKLAVVLNIAALTFMISSFFVATGTLLRSKEITANPAGVTSEDIASLSAPDPLPDIYYIILDSYPGEDSLRQEFGFDNSSFLGYLEDRGFDINNEALSNYYRSAYSIASTLNMDYIHDLATRSEVNNLDGFALSRVIRQSAIRRILSGFGYQTVSFSTGFFLTDVFDADVYYSEDRSGLNPVETTILPWTVYAYLLPFIAEGGEALFAPTYTYHVSTISGTLDLLEASSTDDEPRFFFAHILAPHPPFVFDRDGETIIPPRQFGLDDAGAYPGTTQEYQNGFTDQTIYINDRLKAIIESIQSDLTRPSIIILQGDHGVRWKCDMDSANCEDIWVAYSILDARYLPGVELTENEAALSPVNTFRLILNTYFGGRISYVADSTNISVGDWMILDNIEPLDIPSRP